MRKLVIFMHSSLDGFAAGLNGEMDWIHVDSEIFDYAGDQTDRADIALYGRITYEMMDSYWPTAGDAPDASEHDKKHSAWYNSVLKVVISKSLQDLKLPNTFFIGTNIKEQIQALKNQPGKDILLFGSPSTIHTLMAENLVDEFWIFVNPVLIGEGIPLFEGKSQRNQLKLVSSQAFNSGVICLHYERKNSV